MLLLFFCFTSFTSAKHFPLRTVFIQGNKQTNKKSGWDWVNREGGAWGSCCLGSKTAEHSVRCGQVCSKITHHEMGKGAERVFKNSLKPNTTSHNSATWYTDTDGFLEHSSSRGRLYYKGLILQKITLFFGGFPFLCNSVIFVVMFYLLALAKFSTLKFFMEIYIYKYKWQNYGLPLDLYLQWTKVTTLLWNCLSWIP